MKLSNKIKSLIAVSCGALLIGSGFAVANFSSQNVQKVEAATTYDLGTTIFLDISSQDWWDDSNAIMWIHAWNDSTSKDLQFQATETTNLYYVDLQSSDFTSAKIVRSNPTGGAVGTWTNIWNQTNDLTISGNTFKITSDSNGTSYGTWSIVNTTESDDGTVVIYLNRNGHWEDGTWKFHYWYGYGIDFEIEPSGYVESKVDSRWYAWYEIPVKAFSRGEGQYQFKVYNGSGVYQNATSAEDISYSNNKIYDLSWPSAGPTISRVNFGTPTDYSIMKYVLKHYDACDSNSYFGYGAYSDLNTVWHYDGSLDDSELVDGSTYSVNHTWAFLGSQYGKISSSRMTSFIGDDSTVVILTASVASVAALGSFVLLFKKKKILL